MARYPALDIRGVDGELVLAAVDDCTPVAAEERGDGVRVFFGRGEDRERAASAVAGTWPAAQVTALDVDDEDWARRSQANLEPVTVGRITVVPNSAARLPGSSPETPITIVIQPSMGFGTGHHATTRLCLHALQRLALDERTLLDVGTGSGILAIAACRLGAAAALGVDNDADAIASANDNLALNAGVPGVRFAVEDIRASSPAPADVVCANLTGALLISAAPLLQRLVAPGGTLVLSGLLEEEEDAVRGAFAAGTVTWRAAEQGWIALAVNFA